MGVSDAAVVTVLLFYASLSHSREGSVYRVLP